MPFRFSQDLLSDNRRGQWSLFTLIAHGGLTKRLLSKACVLLLTTGHILQQTKYERNWFRSTFSFSGCLSLCEHVWMCVRACDEEAKLDTVPPGCSWHLEDRLMCTAGRVRACAQSTPCCFLTTVWTLSSAYTHMQVHCALGNWLAVFLFFTTFMFFECGRVSAKRTILMDLIPGTLFLACPSLLCVRLDTDLN